MSDVFSKLSKEYQDVILLLSMMEQHDRLEQMAPHIPGLRSGERMRELKHEIQSMFFVMDDATKQAVVALRAGHNKVWVNWYVDHMKRHPLDWNLELKVLSTTSPYFYAMREGLTEIMNRDMRKMCPEWQEAWDHGTIGDLNRLIYKHIPHFKTLLAQVRLQEKQTPLSPKTPAVKPCGEVDSLTRGKNPKF